MHASQLALLRNVSIVRKERLLIAAWELIELLKLPQEATVFYCATCLWLSKPEQFVGREVEDAR